MLNASSLRMLIATLAAVALVISLSPPAAASHGPTAYCSETGDICQSVRKVDGERRLRIWTAALYFERFELCVRDPEGTEVCEPRRMRERSNDTYAGSVRWRDHIWYQRQPGAYTVRWLVDGSRVGRILGFHVRG